MPCDAARLSRIVLDLLVELLGGVGLAPLRLL
jgi:hypothetical protein